MAEDMDCPGPRPTAFVIPTWIMKNCCAAASAINFLQWKGWNENGASRSLSARSWNRIKKLHKLHKKDLGEVRPTV
jgi:protein gp37